MSWAWHKLVGTVMSLRRLTAATELYSLGFICNRAGEPFSGRVPKLCINFEEILLRAHGNFEEHNKVLESYIITYYCVIVTVALYN